MKPDGASPPPEPCARQPASPLAAGLWLAAVLVGAKAFLLGPPHSTEWLSNLAIATSSDVLHAAVLTALGEAALRLARSPAARRRIGIIFTGFCTLSAFYAVVSVAVFEYFSRPLTIDLLRTAESLAPMRASIAGQMTAPLTAALIGVPLAFLAVSRWMSGVGRLTWWPAAAVAWAAGGWTLHATRPHAVWPRLELNPHAELIRSTLASFGGGARVSFPQDYPPEDALEFQPFAARGPAGKGGAFTPPAGIARPRNVIFIVLESVGVKYLSLYGSPYDTTPHLITEAAHALVIDHGYAHASHTYHSFMAVNFSIYPGLPWCHAPWAGRPCPPALAEVLRDRGCRTGYFHSGDLDWGASRWLLEHHGYGTIEDYLNLGCAPLTSSGTEDRCLFERVIHWIDERPGQPFFALCWTDQTHDPYKVAPEAAKIDFFRGHPPKNLAPELSRYLNIIHEVDKNLGRLFSALRDRGLADETLVVITGDHGEAFRDPRSHRGHGFMVFEEDIHVPLIFWNPALFSPGRRVDAVAGHVDVNPTILDVLGIEPPGEWQGHSLFDRARPPRAFFVTGAGDYHFGLREGSWKYIFGATEGGESLFDLASDPGESRNLAGQEAARCRRMRQRLAAWVNFEENFLRGR